MIRDIEVFGDSKFPIEIFGESDLSISRTEFFESFNSEYLRYQNHRKFKVSERSEFSEVRNFSSHQLFRVIDWVGISTDHYWTLMISMKKVPIGKSVLFTLHCFLQALLTTRWRYRLQMMILFIIMIIITNRIHRLIDMQLFHPK